MSTKGTTLLRIPSWRLPSPILRGYTIIVKDLGGTLGQHTGHLSSLLDKKR